MLGDLDKSGSIFAVDGERQLLTRDEARRIAANIAKQPDLPQWDDAAAELELDESDDHRGAIFTQTSQFRAANNWRYSSIAAGTRRDFGADGLRA
jgi:hypothetical protein